MPVLKIIFGLLGALLLGYGLLLLEKAWEIHRLKKLFLERPIEKISDLRNRISRVRGHVEPKGETLKGPFSGALCLYYKYQIMKQSRGGTFRRLRRQGREIAFSISDESGSIDVLPQNARFIVSHRSFKGSELSEEGKENLKALLAPGKLENLENYQVMEEYLIPGEEITVMGHTDLSKQTPAVRSGPGLPLLAVRCSESAFVVLYSRAFYRLLLISFCFLVSAVMNFHILAAL